VEGLEVTLRYIVVLVSIPKRVCLVSKPQAEYNQLCQENYLVSYNEIRPDSRKQTGQLSPQSRQSKGHP
jgi:hypothetical protein